MPYINVDDRADIEAGRRESFATAGELNYAVTQLALGYIRRHGARYATFNEVIGALECAKLELYRRMVAPYEDQKITENGDIYP